MLYDIIHALRPIGRLERNYQIVKRVKDFLEKSMIPPIVRIPYINFSRDVIEAHDRFGVQDPRREVPDQVIKEYDRALELAVEAEKITYATMGLNRETMDTIAETVHKEILIRKQPKKKDEEEG